MLARVWRPTVLSTSRDILCPDHKLPGCDEQEADRDKDPSTNSVLIQQLRRTKGVEDRLRVS